MRTHRTPIAATALLALALVAAPADVALADPPPNDTPSVACDRRREPVPSGAATLVDSRPSPGAEDRIVELTLDSPALGRATAVNVLLPPEFSETQRYPVLYLLHGAAESHRYWQDLAVQSIVDRAIIEHGLPPFIVVMPDGGGFGFYADWFGLDADGHNELDQPPGWATHHVRELIPWIDTNFPTVPSRDGRAIAGLSMGGFGAMSYASRHPDLFAAAASFSGALNPSYGYPYGNAFLSGASLVFTGRGIDQCIWGEIATQKVHWLAADPTHLAGNLRGAGTELYVASGGGDVDKPAGFVSDPVEQTVYFMSKAFVEALDENQIPRTVDFYGEGGHNPIYWQRGLERFLPLMARAFEATDPGAPGTFSYRSAESSFSVWNWHVQVDRLVTEFLHLDDVGTTGLSMRGSGTATVTTAPVHDPGAAYVITQDDGPATRVVADEAGRLRFAVDLGPSHTTQQMRFDASATDAWREARVTIEKADGPHGSQPGPGPAHRPEAGSPPLPATGGGWVVAGLLCLAGTATLSGRRGGTA